MGRKPTDQEQEDFLNYLRSGKDEMNLLEHSISGADKNPDRTTRSIVFVRHACDPETGKPIERKWKATFSAEFGRPTPKDDDVFVALMRVSKEQGFVSPQVSFTSRQLIRILGWPQKGANFKAIDDALNRLCGVRIVATNYWYDNSSKLWVDRKFGIIDDVFLYERAKFDRAKRAAKEKGEPNPQSWLRWSDVMHESFSAGYVKTLDIEEYRSIDNPIARKLYRYLGKHFWRSTQHVIDVRELCHEKLGYPKYDNNTCKQKLKKPLAELEKRGIYGLSHEFNASYGKCEVVFNALTTTKNAAKTEAKKREPANPLVERLLKLGIDRSTAVDAVKQLDAERIVTDIEHVEYEAKAKRVKSSPAGMLAQMLKSAEPWGRPQGFQSSFERERTKKKVNERVEAERKAKEAEDQRRRKEEEQNLLAFNEFMAGVSDEAAAELDEQAKWVFWYGERYREALKKGDAGEVAAARHAALYAVWSTKQKGETKSTVVQKSIQF